jgi:hypothetical protein
MYAHSQRGAFESNWLTNPKAVLSMPGMNAIQLSNVGRDGGGSFFGIVSLDNVRIPDCPAVRLVGKYTICLCFVVV